MYSVKNIPYTDYTVSTQDVHLGCSDIISKTYN